MQKHDLVRVRRLDDIRPSPKQKKKGIEIQMEMHSTIYPGPYKPIAKIKRRV